MLHVGREYILYLPPLQMAIFDPHTANNSKVKKISYLLPKILPNW